MPRSIRQELKEKNYYEITNIPLQIQYISFTKNCFIEIKIIYKYSATSTVRTCDHSDTPVIRTSSQFGHFVFKSLFSPDVDTPNDPRFGEVRNYNTHIFRNSQAVSSYNCVNRIYAVLVRECDLVCRFSRVTSVSGNICIRILTNKYLNV